MLPEQSPSSPVRRYALLAAKVSISTILLGVLFSKVDGAELWETARLASLPWLLVGLAVYTVSALAAVWRWHILLKAQHVRIAGRSLVGSYLVAGYFNNFLPSNIGGDLIRIRDTARAAGSKTLATTVVAMDRVLGLMALVLVAAVGATAAGRLQPNGSPIWAVWLWAGFLVGAAATTPAVFALAGVGRLLRPLTVFHAEWVSDRITKLTGALSRFRDEPGALLSCFGGALFVQASMVVFYFAVAYALHLDVTMWDLGVIVPISFIVQLLPVSINGFGVREATFSLYFSRIGQPIESAVVMSLVAQALLMMCSLSGAAIYVWRGRHPSS